MPEYVPVDLRSLTFVLHLISTDLQTLSTARFRRAGPFATAGTCFRKLSFQHRPTPRFQSYMAEDTRVPDSSTDTHINVYITARPVISFSRAQKYCRLYKYFSNMLTTAFVVVGNALMQWRRRWMHIHIADKAWHTLCHNKNTHRLFLNIPVKNKSI